MQTLLLSRQIQHLRHSKKISSQSHNKEEDGINYRESVIGMHEKMEGGETPKLLWYNCDLPAPGDWKNPF